MGEYNYTVPECDCPWCVKNGCRGCPEVHETAADKAKRTMPLPEPYKTDKVTVLINGVPFDQVTNYYGGSYREYPPESVYGHSAPVADQCEPLPPAAVPPVSINPKDLLGMKKAPMALNPPVALIHMAKAFEFGAYGRDANGVQVRPKGYGPYNWRENAVSAMVYLNAAQRHLAEYLDRTDVADDSKVQQLGHVMACCAIVLDAMEQGNLIDDRPKKGRASEVIDRLMIKEPRK